jgi:hypothetical protein
MKKIVVTKEFRGSLLLEKTFLSEDDTKLARGLAESLIELDMLAVPENRVKRVCIFNFPRLAQYHPILHIDIPEIGYPDVYIIFAKALVQQISILFESGRVMNLCKAGGKLPDYSINEVLYGLISQIVRYRLIFLDKIELFNPKHAEKIPYLKSVIDLIWGRVQNQISAGDFDAWIIRYLAEGMRQNNINGEAALARIVKTEPRHFTETQNPIWDTIDELVPKNIPGKEEFKRRYAEIIETHNNSEEYIRLIITLLNGPGQEIIFQ